MQRMVNVSFELQFARNIIHWPVFGKKMMPFCVARGTLYRLNLARKQNSLATPGI
jgi:hypothetical protein